MSDKKSKIIIQGITQSGEVFRPSDWAERMSGGLSTFHKHRMRYSPLLQPSTHEGNKCILLDPELKNLNPELYQSVLDFAENNNLQICRENDEGK